MREDIRYDVGQLFQIAFGINSPIYITQPLLRRQPAEITYTGIERLPEYYEPTSTSWMGTPILFDAKFEGGLYWRYKDNAELERVQMGDFTLPPATMFQFRRAKNIVKTNVLGSNGTVKEIFGFDDWIIDVRGLALDEPGRSAQEQIKELLEWEKLADSIEVVGELFSIHGIKRVAIEDWADNIVQGKPGVRAFNFQMSSDKNLEV